MLGTSLRHSMSFTTEVTDDLYLKLWSLIFCFIWIIIGLPKPLDASAPKIVFYHIEIDIFKQSLNCRSNFSKCVNYTLKRHSREVTIITWQQQQQKVGPTTRKQFRDLARAVGCSTVTVKFIIFSGPHISSLLRFAAFLASNVCRSHYLQCTLENELEA